MKGLAITLVAVLVVCAVSVGAFNIINDTDNKPMPLYDILKAFAEIDLGETITVSSFEDFIEHFESLNDKMEDDIPWDEYYYDYEASFFENVENFVNEKTFILRAIYRVLLLVFYLLKLVFSVVLDTLLSIFSILKFAHSLLTGVPSS